MRDEILTYWEMCARENGSLQRGMYFREPPAASVVLMSRRPSAPYEDSLSEDGTELEYEGHDVHKSPGVDPKRVDQPWELASGRLTENAKFANVAGKTLVRVYEKLKDGIWSDRGLFRLVDYDYRDSGGRKVFKFRMRLTDEDLDPERVVIRDSEPSRVIPSWVKQAVYKRDKGRCVICGADDELHFDHDLPYSLGGTGMSPQNIRILCARHNLSKGARIE